MKNVTTVKDQLHENKVLDLCEQVKYCEGELEACKKIDKANKKDIANLCDRMRLNKNVCDCMVYLMREEDGTKKEIIKKFGREIKTSGAEKDSLLSK